MPPPISAHGREVLKNLADLVDTLADAAGTEADALEQIAKAHRTYVGAVRAILTGIDIPPESPGGPIVMEQSGAVSATNALGSSLLDMLSSIPRQGDGRAEELDRIREKEEEEKGGGTQTGTGEPSTTTPDPGTGTGTTGKPTAPTPQPPTSHPGTTTTGGGGTPVGDPHEPGKPGQPESPQPEPPKIIKRTPRRRRCYEFYLRNTGNRPVSDLHFTGGTPASMTPPADSSWAGSNATQGFQFATPEAAKAVPPGGKLGPFEFCSDEPFQAKIFLTHPSGPPSQLQPGDVTVRGKPVPVDADGVAHIPASSRKFVTELTVNTAGNRDMMNVALSDPNATVEGPDGIEITKNSKGEHVLGYPASDPRLGPNQEVRIRVISDHPNVSGSLFPHSSPGTASKFP